MSGIEFFVQAIILLIPLYFLYSLLVWWRGGKGISDSLKRIRNYDADTGYVRAKIQKATNQAHAEAIKARVQVRDALIDLKVDDHLVEKKKAEREIEFKKVDYERKMLHLQLEWEWETKRLQHELEHAVIEGAKERRVDSQTYAQLMVIEGQAKVDVEKEKQLSGVRVEEHKQLKAIDVDAELAQQLNTIHAILKYKHLSFNQYDEIRLRIMSLIEEEDKIQNSNASALVKGQHLELIEDAKQTYKGALNEIKNRLLEAGDGEEISGIESFADVGRFAVGTEAESKNQTPALVTRRRGGEDNDS